MSCDAWKEMLADHLAGELSEEDSILLEQHLDECPPCREEERFLREILSAQAPDDGWRPSDQLLPRLLDQLRIEKPAHLDRRNPAQVARLVSGGRRSLGLMGFLLRPFPSYATLVVVLAAMAGGVLIGRVGRADQSWTAGPTSPDRALEERRGVESSSPPASDEGKSVPEALEQPMFASSVLESLGFVPARADAVGLPTPAESDSL